MKRLTLFLLLVLATAAAPAAITVTFRHYPTAATVQRAFVPGTFNNWGPNASGVITVGAPSQMSWVDSLGCYVKQVQLAVGTTYNYKFHEHLNASGSSWQWLSDPLNPLINTGDNNNSVLIPEPLMLFEVSPAAGALVTDERAWLTAGAFAAAGDSLLPSASTIAIDGTVSTTLESCYLPTLGLIRYPLPRLQNGEHAVRIRLVSRSGATVEGSTRFSTLTGDLFFMTPSCDSLFASERTIRWRVNRSFTEIKSLSFMQSGKSPVTLLPEPDGEYSRTVTCARGENAFVVSLNEISGGIIYSDTLRLRYPLPQAPVPGISLTRSGDRIKITGSARDPQNKTMTYRWTTSALNPAPLPGLDGSSELVHEIDPPSFPGDYSLKLTATDADGFSGSAETFFTLRSDSTVVLPNLATAPQWVRDARIYCLFFKAFTASGRIADAIPRLDYIKALGFNVIWVLPVMDVEGIIDQGANVGYNIIDFQHVDPVYGSDADFKAFVETAHQVGLRVILDITPNHSSRSHPFALDARANRKYSRYYDFYQHEMITHDTNGLGQSVSSDGIVYYSGFSDALLNWNWSDAEARTYMLEVYKYWLREFDIDGFRFDVWWGPHRRYGVNTFDKPLRLALRTVKSDILLLGETAGTGSGTEDNYADKGGGMDMGYDWTLFGSLSSYPAPATLQLRLTNSGYRPGPNSFFLRFLENQDEDRVIFRYGGGEKTLPVSTAVFMATGIPLLYAGQEAGMGLYGSTLDARRRGTINWSGLYAPLLTPHYQKLAQIRAQFPAFRTQFEDSNGDSQITGSDRNVQIPLETGAGLYAMARPWIDANGLALMNFSALVQEIALPLKAAEWMLFSEALRPGGRYYLNDLYAGTTTSIRGTDLDTLRVSLPPYGVAIYTIATREQHLLLPNLDGVARQTPAVAPERFHLAGSYPNPFNSRTTIRFALPVVEPVEAEIFNALGQRVRQIWHGMMPAGEHELLWDGRSQSGANCPSGLYILRLRHGEAVAVHKMALVR
ncbi:MAG TPA: alpha-amylase family glycosyl hydrolase [bacterium]|nr:alpha-amylase family glycosyl hydrolase [bacterium]HQI47831.1 alpha-amylase family glycosyl hydrolase [bacterium]HQJ64005.1 alpha-amylase family glycosyl hydrolase [bacterium]